MNYIKNLLSQYGPARKIYTSYKSLYARIYRRLYSNVLNASMGNSWLINALNCAQPFGAGKIGSLELEGLRVFIRDPRLLSLTNDLREKLYANVGIFPASNEGLKYFFETYLASLNEIDLLGVWFNPGEQKIVKTYAKQARLTEIRALEPYYHKVPWSKVLSGKKVLLISPFTRSCSQQYLRREKIWPMRTEILPSFELITLKAPLSAALVKPQYADWASTLEHLKQEILQREFDIALIGVGGYSLPLVAFCKKLGKQAIHMGGATQILFGVAGSRWDKSTDVYEFINTDWVTPSGDEKPENVQKIERGCYW